MSRTGPGGPRRRRPPTPAQQERADELFDALSSALRDIKEPGADPVAALRHADHTFGILHAHLCRGGALPTPWHKARHP
ncbi:hypothetical protein [Nocardiopsis sp. CC223A]|uniref:hypothetical protein n=1 Tax=Nocardiopsis sp. CC223A TaxID=3044051 RepID=UPI00278C58E5|nr:hypothetical protein [Nocardiopsis sp. CC223A]